MEAFIPVLVDRMTTLLHELGEDTLVVSVEPARVDSRAQDLLDTGKEFLEAAWSNAAAGNVTPVDIAADGLQGGMFRTLPELHELAEDLGLAWWTAGTLSADAELRDATAARLVTIEGRGVNGYRGDLQEASRDLAAHVADGWRLVVVTEGHGPAQHLVQVLTGADVPARLVASLDTRPSPGWSTSPAAGCSTASSASRCGWRCSPRPTSPASAPPPRTCARCRPSGATWSTRSP
jgi:transcription-repair coupling factor (superfamily II helicase)